MESQRTAFGTVMFGGFDKEAVYQYIEQLVKDHETVCKRYEYQYGDLQKLADELRLEKEALSAKCDALLSERDALQKELDELKQSQKTEE